MKIMNFKILLGIIGLSLMFGISYWQFSMKQRTVLFLCVHNTFRSQMAEAYFNKFAKEKRIKWRAKSAGLLKAEKINEKAVILMQEEGIDISDKKPKLMTKKMIDKAEKIIVVCRECEEQGLCVNLPKNKDIAYWRLPNPAEMELDEARAIRNKIKENVINLIEELK